MPLLTSLWYYMHILIDFFFFLVMWCSLLYIRAYLWMFIVRWRATWLEMLLLVRTCNKFLFLFVELWCDNFVCLFICVCVSQKKTPAYRINKWCQILHFGVFPWAKSSNAVLLREPLNDISQLLHLQVISSQWLHFPLSGEHYNAERPSFSCASSDGTTCFQAELWSH